MSIETTREARARRHLSTLDMRLHKTPSRHWTREHYGPGYMVTKNNIVRVGCRQHEYDASLEHVEAFVADEMAKVTA